MLPRPTLEVGTWLGLGSGLGLGLGLGQGLGQELGYRARVRVRVRAKVRPLGHRTCACLERPDRERGGGRSDEPQCHQLRLRLLPVMEG